MTVSFSFELPTHRVDVLRELVTGQAVGEFAVAAERAGFSACHVTDHPAPDARWLDAGGHHALDPFVALSFAAASTSSIKLLTHILVVAYRNPFLTAKSVQSLHVLSGGRAILGTGAGYLKPEFAALGVDFDERNELFDEALDVMVDVWSGADTAVTGRRFSARGVRFVPALQPRPPVWVGGNTQRAMRRAVTRFEGWAPFGTAGYAKASRTVDIGSVEDLGARIASAHQLAAEIGRDAPLDICYSSGDLGDPAASVEERHDRIGRFADVGVTWLTVSIPGDTRGAVLEGIAAFADEFIGTVTGS